MELKIKSPTQANPFINKISFASNNIMLHADQEIWLPYEETELEIILKLGVSSSALHSQGAQVAYVPFVDYLIFVFHTPQTTYTLNHKEKIDILFALLDENHPFKKLTFSFQGHTLDFPRQQLAAQIAQQLADHTKYHLHNPSQNIITHILPFPVPSQIMCQELEQDFSLTTRLYVRMGLCLIGIIFSVFVMAYLIPQWENDPVCWGFGIFCFFLTSFCGFWFYSEFKKWRICQKLTRLKQAEKDKSN